MKNLSTATYNFFRKDQFRICLFLLLVFLSIFSVYALKPHIDGGDSIEYVQSIQVLRGEQTPNDFTPNRIITSLLGLKVIMFVEGFMGNLAFSWLIMNSILYVAMGMFFYMLLAKILDNRRSAFLGTLFLVTNYATLVFGLHYLMDMGGWTFYVASLYFSFKYMESKEDKWLYIASVLVSVGGLVKEYSFVAYIVIFGLIVFTEWKNWSKMIKKVVLTGLIAFIPTLVLNIYVFSIFHYSYINWFSHQSIYHYNSRILEYIKSFGSLYNFGWFLFLGGLPILFKRSKKIFQDKTVLFIWLVILSSSLVFVWPIVTRVLFITMPGVVMVSSLFLRKIDKWWYAVVLLLILYVLSSYFMDAYILDFVNIGVLANYFH